MRAKGFTRKAAGIICAAALFFTGCEVEFGTNKKEESEQLPADHIVAKPAEGAANEDILSVTFGDFQKEYLYYLAGKGIEDDTDEKYAEDCKEVRKEIINSVLFERVIMVKAKELGADVFTDEEKKYIDEEFEKEIASLIKSYGEKADYGELSKDEITDELREQKGKERMKEVFDKCGMTENDVRGWIESYLIMNKALEEYGKTLDKSEADTLYKSYVDEIKKIYEEDPSEYEKGNYYTFWIPEGSRRIKHVLIGFDDETLNEITELRLLKRDEEANTVRQTAAAELADKVAAAEAALDAGEDWNNILLNYSADAMGSSLMPDGYLVVPGGTNYPEEFQKGAFEIETLGGRKNVITDNGVHIMIYASDAVISEKEQDDIRSYLFANIAQQRFSEMLNKAFEDYRFDIDYEALRLTDEDTSH